MLLHQLKILRCNEHVLPAMVKNWDLCEVMNRYSLWQGYFLFIGIVMEMVSDPVFLSDSKAISQPVAVDW